MIVEKPSIAGRLAIEKRSGTADPSLIISLWILLFLYAFARVLTVFPSRVSMLAILALHIFPPGIFALIHGSIVYRARGILVFTALCLTVGNIFENLGVLTGFPFGHYYFTDVMGPKLFQVPLLIGPAYLGMGYLSWTLARMILRNTQSALGGLRLLTTPLLAGFIMVAWDLSSDPVWSTVKSCWIWRDGGLYFGVPVTNFMGWYLTVYIFYQLFALYLRGDIPSSDALPSGFWRLAVLFYAACAMGNVLLIFGAHGVVSDPTGKQWTVSAITGAGTLVSIFIMGAFAVLAWMRMQAQASAKKVTDQSCVTDRVSA